MSYQDFANTTKFLTPGTISIEAIRKAQKADSFTLNLLKNKSKQFVKIDDRERGWAPNNPSRQEAAAGSQESGGT